MHRFFVSDENELWARDLVHRITMEAARLDFPIDARMGQVQGAAEADWPYTHYIEVERLDTAQMLSPGEHFDGFEKLAGRLAEITAGDMELLEPILEVCGLYHDPAPTRSVAGPQHQQLA